MANEQRELKVNDTTTGTQLAQVGIVNANGNLVTMDFVYVHPRQAVNGQPTMDGQVVSRVTMPFTDARAFAEALGNVLAEHGKKYTEQ